MPSRPRVLIADDHTLIAELCKRVLEAEFDVVGIVGDGRAMVRAAIQQKPHVVVVDLAMPILNGLDAGQQAKKECPAIKLVFLTVNSDPEVAAEAFRRGASAYLLKTCAASELLIAVHEVLRGKSYLSRTLPRDHVRYLQTQQRTAREEDARLTRRQREVLQLIAEGKLMREIGDILFMTPRTVAFHKYKMMQVLGVRTTAELVRFAMRNHLISA